MKRIKLFCDPMLTTMSLVWWIVILPFSTVFIFWSLFFSESSNIVNTLDWILSVIICLIPILNYIVLVFCIPVHFNYVIVNKFGIKWISPLKKKVAFYFEDFKVVKIACYQHIYEKRFFLVMSRDFLSMSELTHINQLRCSDSLVKISINKRNYKVLSEILPDYIKNQMDEALNDSSACVNIDAEKNRLKRQDKNNKKKRKKRKRR